MNSFNHFTFSAWLTSIATLLIGVFVLFKGGGRKKVYILFSLYSFSIAWWSFCVTKFSPSFQDPSLIWGRLLHLGAVFIPVLFLHFVLEFLGEQRKIVINVSYAITAIFLICNFFTRYFITGITVKAAYTFPTPGIVYPFYVTFFVGSFLFGLYELFRRFRIAPEAERNQIKYLMWATLLGYTGGLKNFLILIDVHIFPIYPFGTYAIPVYVLIVAYAILKHHLMDIKILIKRTTLIALAGILPAAGFYYVILFTEDYLKQMFGNNWWIIPSILGACIFVGILKLTTYLLTMREKELKTYQDNLRELLAKIDETNRLREAFVFIPHYITKITEIPYAAIAFIEEENFSITYKVQGLSDYTKSGLRVQLKDYAVTSGHLIQMLKDNHVISYNDAPPTVQEAMNFLGAKLIVPCISGYQLLGFVILGEKKGGYSPEDIEFFESLSKQAATYMDKLLHQENNMRMLEIFTDDSLKEIDTKDNYAYWHTKRVAQYSLMVARNKNISPLIRKTPTGLWGLGLSAELHDIGKKYIPDEILKKKGSLTKEEYMIMQTHAEKGLDVIYKYSSYLKKDIIAGIVEHHEHHNGKGYPKGLEGDEIALYARIIHVADSFDAMTSNRPYRKGLALEVAVEEIEKNRGIQFNPQIVDAFIEELDKRPELKRAVKDRVKEEE